MGARVSIGRMGGTRDVQVSSIASRVLAAYAIAGALGVACGGRESASASVASSDAAAGVDASSDAAVDADAAPAVACDDAFGATICHGTLDPTALGSGILPVGRAGQPAMHYFCRPASRAPNGRLLVHLVDRGDSPSRLHRFATRACSLGFAAIVPAYENAVDVRAQCGSDDACSRAAHETILYDGDDALDHRVATLLAALATTDAAFAPWPSWSDRWTSRDDARVAVSGHARGGDHALFLAKDRAFERALLLAGPTERVAWIDSYANDGGATRKLLGYVHADDTVSIYADVRAGWQSLGIDAASCAFSNGPCAPGCLAVVSPTQGCSGYYAHLAVAVASYGPNCEPGIGPSSNASTWAHLLDAP